MENIILEAHCGNNFSDVAKKAKGMAKLAKKTIEFDFNGIICLVESGTNTEWLYRDYANADLMFWKTVGPNCLPEYEPIVQNELDRRKELAEVESEERLVEYRAKEEKERIIFNEKVSGIEIELKDEEGWKKSREANQDPYGKATLDYADGWAKLMQVEAMKKGYTNIDVVVLSGIAEKTSHELGFMGITGFMYGQPFQLFHNAGNTVKLLENGTIKNMGMKVMEL
jgi:hypothetical protein